MGLNLDELETLSILDAIEVNNRVTQRELSRSTGLSLAKVNFLIRRLAEKGQVKLRNFDMKAFLNNLESRSSNQSKDVTSSDAKMIVTNGTGSFVV